VPALACRASQDFLASFERSFAAGATGEHYKDRSGTARDWISGHTSPFAREKLNCQIRTASRGHDAAPWAESLFFLDYHQRWIVLAHHLIASAEATLSS
jgi:hypothetical protein